MLDRRRDLVLRDHGRGGYKNVVAAITVNAALHGVDQEPTLGRCLGHAAAEIDFGWEWSFRGLARDELDGPEQADSPHVADGIQAAQMVEGLLQRGSNA